MKFEDFCFTLPLLSNSVSVSFTPTAVIRKMHEKERSQEAASPKSTPGSTPAPTSSAPNNAVAAAAASSATSSTAAPAASSTPHFTSGSQVLATLNRLTPSSRAVATQTVVMGHMRSINP